MLKELIQDLPLNVKAELFCAFESGEEAIHKFKNNQFVGVNITHPNFEVFETKGVWSCGIIKGGDSND